MTHGASTKRTEENYKLVFNWCFKHLRRQLSEKASFELKRPASKKELEDFFYKYYFNEVAEKLSIDINKFYKPNFTNKQSNNNKFKPVLKIIYFNNNAARSRNEQILIKFIIIKKITK